MIINVNSPTYQYIRPILFGGVECCDSKRFAEVILDNWDDAITAYKCGEWSDLWNVHTDLDKAEGSEIQRLFNEPYGEMWQIREEKNADVLFTKALHYIEPAMGEIPCFISNQYQLELWPMEKYQDYFQKEPACEECLEKLVKYNWAEDSKRDFDGTKEGILYACHMLREGLFTVYGYEPAGRMSELLEKIRKEGV